MLKIYSADLSSPGNKVRFVANALNLDYEDIKINIREAEHRSEEHLKRHPAGKVPAIDDDGFVMFESDAISKYLCDKQSSALYPKDLKARAKVDQWMDFSSIHIGAAMGRVLFNRVFAKVINAEVDERSLSDGIGFLERFLPVIDAQLGRSAYLAGDELTIADICLLATIDSAEVAEIDISRYANLDKWRKGLQQEEFYTKCHSSYGEALQKMMANS